MRCIRKSAARSDPPFSVQARHDIRHPRAIVDLARRLADSVGSLYTLNSQTNYLKSLGHNVPKSSVADYLDWFEDAYFLFTVRLFDASYSKSNANPKKVYAIDHSSVRSVSTGILINAGHLLENMVFVESGEGVANFGITKPVTDWRWISSG